VGDLVGEVVGLEDMDGCSEGLSVGMGVGTKVTLGTCVLLGRSVGACVSLGAVVELGGDVTLGATLGGKLFVGSNVGLYVGAIPGKQTYFSPVASASQHVAIAHSSKLSSNP